MTARAVAAAPMERLGRFRRTGRCTGFSGFSEFRDGRHTGQGEPGMLAAKMNLAIRDIDAQMAQGNH